MDMECTLRQDLYWNKKTKCKWLKEGDGNTSIFIGWQMGERGKTVSSLLIQGQMVHDFQKIKDEAIHYYSSLYKKEGGDIPRIPNLFSSKIDVEAARNLEKSFSVEEVRQAVMSMMKYKLSGLDGFSVLFFQESWDIV